MPRLHIITNRFPATRDDQASPFVRDFAQAVAARGIEVDVSTPGYTKKREQPDGLTVNWLPWRGKKEVIGSSNPLNPIDALAIARFTRAAQSKILDRLREKPADHCLALWALPSGWFALQARKRLGVPYSVWCLGSDIYVWAKRPVLGRLTRGVLSSADNLFADAEDLCAAVREVTRRDCRFLPSLRLLPERHGGTEPRMPERETERGETHTGAVKFRLAYVGRFETAKGVFVALEALAAARLREPRLTLSLLGWGPDEEQMRARCHELGLGEAVSFHGMGGPSEVAALLRESHCLVIPSFRDSIPLVFGEALQTGTPLIVTDVGDMGSLTREHDLGKVVDPGSVDGLANAMIEMISGGPPAGYRNRMKTLVRRFSPSVAAETFISAAFLS